MLEVFKYGEQQIRTAGDANNPLFVGVDVCKALEIKNSRDALSRLDGDDVGFTDVTDSLGRIQSTKAVTESGLYKLIFQSRTEGAKVFQRWVTHEVLPAIRKTGKYSVEAGHQEELRAIEAAKFKEQALQLACQSQLNALQAAKGLVHPDHLEAKARIVLARSLHEVPELDPVSRPLYVKSFLKEKNLSKTQMKRSGQFGKQVKAAYIKKYGVAPGKAPLNLSSGRIIETFAYTEADRPLLEEVFTDYFGSFLRLVS